MALRRIFQDGEAVLTKVCRPVEKFDDRLGTLLDGVGLAAPQVGILRRIAVVEADDVYLELVNPQIIDFSGEQLGEEGCLSVDSSKNCRVLRPKTVTVSAFDRNGNEFEKTVSDLPARAVCHELDHLEGILFYTKNHDGAKK